MPFGAAQLGRQVIEPFRGAPHTVAQMTRCALEAQTYYPLRLLAEQLVGGLPSKDYVSEILAVYYWVCGHTRYANDPRTVELVRGARDPLSRLQNNVTALSSGGGRWKPSLDCDDLACLLAALFLSLGREVQFVTVAFKDVFYGTERQYQHVYLRVREPRTNTWIVLDPVAAEDTAEMLRKVKAMKIWPIA